MKPWIGLLDRRGRIAWVHVPDSRFDASILVGTVCWDWARTPADRAEILSQVSTSLISGEPVAFTAHAEIAGHCLRFRVDILPIDMPGDIGALVNARPVPTGIDKLTMRETEVLRALAMGESLKSFCCTADISRSTVGTHISKIQQKLGLCHMHSVIAFAVEHFS